MANDTDVNDFSNQCRLFPLPDVVFFPHTILPLHIFEPRYRQMTEDALAGDRLITIVQIRSAAAGSQWTEPVPIMEIGCLGRIIQHKRLDDGRFNFLLLGCKRVRLGAELPSRRLYRIAEAAILEDEAPEGKSEPDRRELIDLFIEVFQKFHRLDPDLSKLLDSTVPVGVLSDIIAHTLSLSSVVKQALLEETRIDRRVETLRRVLRAIKTQDEAVRSFPPPFSVN